MIKIDFSAMSLRTEKRKEKTYVFDELRKKWLVLTKEEFVRQLFIQYIIREKKYPLNFISIEKKIIIGNLSKRYDIVVYDSYHQPWMLIECKEPEQDVSEKTLHQLLQYQNVIKAKFWVVTNGRETYCADAQDIHNIQWLPALPVYNL